MFHISLDILAMGAITQSWNVVVDKAYIISSPLQVTKFTLDASLWFALDYYIIDDREIYSG